MPYKDQEKRTEAVRRHREGLQEGITEGGITQGITRMSWEEQQRRFPNIPLPFGDAYYKALEEQEDKGGNDGSNHKG